MFSALVDGIAWVIDLLGVELALGSFPTDVGPVLEDTNISSSSSSVTGLNPYRLLMSIVFLLMRKTREVLRQQVRWITKQVSG